MNEQASQSFVQKNGEHPSGLGISAKDGLPGDGCGSDKPESAAVPVAGPGTSESFLSHRLSIQSYSAERNGGETGVDPDPDCNPGPFPVEALNPVQKELVAEVAEQNQLAVELPAMVSLATIAAAAGKGWVGFGLASGKATYSNLYVVVGAPKSYGKGSMIEIVNPIIEASNGLATEFRERERPALVAEMQEIQVEMQRMNRAQGRPPRAGMAGMRADEKAQLSERRSELNARLAKIEPLLKYDPGYYISGTTTAGLVEMLSRNGDALMHFSPEAGDPIRVALGRYSKDGKADIDLLLSGYSVEPYGNMTIGRGDHRLTPCLTLCWLVQPCLLEELMSSPEAVERGMLARLLAFSIHRDEIPEDDGTSRTISDKARSGWAQLVTSILKQRPEAAEPNRILWSKDARDVFCRFHNESVRLRNGPFKDIEGDLGRWRENAIRIGNCLAIADAPRGDAQRITGTPEQAERAVAIARWAAFSQLQIVLPGRARRRWQRLERLEKFVKGAADRQMTLRDLKGRH